ncbi:MAG: hypothetical protein ABI411_00660 [Tahibacter sp.]
MRKLVPDFHKSALRHRMDEAVSTLGRLPDATLDGLMRSIAARPVVAPPVDAEAAVWRDVVAELRSTHPATFDLIQRAVDVRLGRSPAEPMPAEVVNGATAAVVAVFTESDTAVSILADSDGDVPSPDVLNAVAEGLRSLTDRQREWCMGEAMVLMGFQMGPQELLSRGDQALARVIVTGSLD